MSLRLEYDPNACTIGWGPGCDSYHGGHMCDRDRQHNGRHRCACGATKRGATPDALDSAQDINRATED